MSTALRLACLSLPLLLAGCAVEADPPSAATAAPPARVLVFTQTLGWRHDSIPEAVTTLRALGQQAGFEVVHSEDPTLFDDGTLSQYAVVVFANTTGDLLDHPQRAAFERYVRAGGGFVGVHSAADTGYDWPWYGALVGAWFDSHPPGLQTTEVRFERRPPAGGSGTWQVTDEIYNYRSNPRPRVQVIATIDPSLYAGATMGADHPIAWCHDRFGGRAWYTGLGHDASLYVDPVFRAHLAQGLHYAGRQSDDC